MGDGILISCALSLIFFLLGYIYGKRSEERIIEKIENCHTEEIKLLKAMAKGNVDEYEIKKYPKIKPETIESPAKVIFTKSLRKKIQKASKEHKNEVEQALNLLANRLYPPYKIKRLSKSNFFVFRTQHLKLVFKEENDKIYLLDLVEPSKRESRRISWNLRRFM